MAALRGGQPASLRNKIGCISHCTVSLPCPPSFKGECVEWGTFSPPKGQVSLASGLCAICFLSFFAPLADRAEIARAAGRAPFGLISPIPRVYYLLSWLSLNSGEIFFAILFYFLVT